jgi:hypothetical protein
MNNNLTQHAPRSPKESLFGIVTLPRFIDKVRASNEGTLGEYKVGPESAVDKALIDFLGIDLESFKDAAKDMNDKELISWIKEHSTNHSEEEIKKWSNNFLNLLAKDDPSRQMYIGMVLEKMGLDPETTNDF